MATKKFKIATVIEKDPRSFDKNVNALIAEGYYLKKRKAIPSETGVHLVAFLDKKYYAKAEHEDKQTKEIEGKNKKNPQNPKIQTDFKEKKKPKQKRPNLPSLENSIETDKKPDL